MRARIGSLFSKFGPRLWPFLRDTTVDQRIGLTFFATLIGLGLGSSLLQLGRLLGNLALLFWNVARRRSIRAGMVAVQFGSMLDVLKLAVLVAIPIAGIVVLIAGGGSFGGAGARVHW